MQLEKLSPATALPLFGQAVSPVQTSPMPEYHRKLPHCQPEGRFLFITWLLFGSLPNDKPVDSRTYPTKGHAFVARDRQLASCATGPKWLEEPAIAELVANTILAADKERRFYNLSAWVVMPNHVHLLILPLVPVPSITKWIKGSTAREANKLLRRTGNPFWQDESYDHYVRNEEQTVRTGLSSVDRIVAYIEHNPVATGLASISDQWPWSSAGWQANDRN